MRTRFRPLAVVLAILVGTGTAAAAGPTPTGPTSTSGRATVAPRPGLGGPRLTGFGNVVPAGAARLPADLTAHAWVLADLDSGAVLAARNPHGRYLPASTLKTLTALTLIPVLADKRRTVVCTDDDAGIEGSKVGVVPGGRYTVEQLFLSLLLVSGNDAANALARTAGGVQRTVALMNAEAARLRALDTHAATPSGLDGPGQSVSAYDMALMERAALRLPDFRRYTAARLVTIPAQTVKKRKYRAFQIANQNRLLYGYRGAFAGKTGFTDAARHTYVAAAARGGRRLVVTFLHAERRPVDLDVQAARLLDWGFRLPRAAPPVGVLVEPVPPGGAAPAPAAPPAASVPAPGSAPARAAASPGHRRDAVGMGGILVAVAVAAGLLLVRRRRARRW